MDRFGRFARELESAQIAVNQMDDEFTWLRRDYETIVAENKRLKFANYGTHDDRFLKEILRAAEEVTHCVTCTECGMPTGSMHKSECGKRIQGCPEVIEDDACPLEDAYPHYDDVSPPERRELQRRVLRSPREAVDIVSYFDVTKWRWCAEALIPYVGAYVVEEIDRGNAITPETIANAKDAFDGGAR